MIIINHLNGTFFEGDLNILNKNNILASGVDIFFIISGFLMFMLIEKRKYNFRQFIITRISKIIPIYFTVTIILFLFDNLYNIFPNKEVLFNDLIRSLTFTNIFFDNKEVILGVGWTLEYEIIFYLIVALTILFKFNTRNSSIFITAVIFCLCIILNNFLFIEFLFGGLAFFIIRYKLYKNIKYIIPLIFLGVISFFLLEGRLIIFGIPMLFIFLFSFLINQKNTIKALPNNLSYELYIYHILIIKVIENIGIMSNLPYIINLCLILTITIIVSYISNVLENSLKKLITSSSN